MTFVAWMNRPAGRTLRVALGVALVTVGAATGGSGGAVLAVVGLVPLLAGALGRCLIAPLLHVPARSR